MFKNVILQLKEVGFIKKMFNKCYLSKDVSVIMEKYFKEVETILSNYKSEIILHKDKIKSLEECKTKSLSLLENANLKIEEIRKSKIVLVNDLENYKKQATENKKSSLNCDGSYILSMDKKISKLNAENEKLKKEITELKKKKVK